MNILTAKSGISVIGNIVKAVLLLLINNILFIFSPPWLVLQCRPLGCPKAKAPHKVLTINNPFKD